jgi:hypothetical protein
MLRLTLSRLVVVLLTLTIVGFVSCSGKGGVAATVKAAKY